MYTLKLVYMYINRVNIYTYVLKIQSILRVANSSEHESLQQAIDIPRHVMKLLIFNSHYYYVKLLFKVNQKIGKATSVHNDSITYRKYIVKFQCYYY